MVTNIQTCAVYVDDFHHQCHESNCGFSSIIFRAIFLGFRRVRRLDGGLLEINSHKSSCDVLLWNKCEEKKHESAMPFAKTAFHGHYSGVININDFVFLYRNILLFFCIENTLKEIRCLSLKTDNGHYRLIVLSSYRFSIRNTFLSAKKKKQTEKRSILTASDIVTF